MSVKITGRLLESSTIELRHGPSGTVIRTAPPVDNGGDGSSFSPTDLCAASLGSCAATILSLFATRARIPVEEVTFEVEKIMNATPRRLGRLNVRFQIKTSCSEFDFERLVAAARSCPVRLSLGVDVEVVETYERVPAVVETEALAATAPVEALS